MSDSSSDKPLTGAAKAAHDRKVANEQEQLGASPEPEAPKRPEPEAPKRSSSGGGGSSRGPGRPRKAALEDRLADAITMVGVAAHAAGDDFSAELIADRAEPLAEAWGRLAKNNTRVRKALERLLSGGEVGGVVFLTAATVLPIAAHHGLAPERLVLLAYVGRDVPDAPEPEPAAPAAAGAFGGNGATV